MPAPPNVTGYTALTQQCRLAIENTPGEQLLLAQTAGAATMSLTTQPNLAGMATTGAHLHLYVIGNPGAGTVTIAGTNPAGGSITSQTYHLNAAPLNAQGYSEICTSEVFATVNASGITMSAGLLPCQVIVFGAIAGKFLIPIEVDAYEEVAKFSPVDKRGILYPVFRVQQIHKWATLSKLDASLYPDSLWLLYMLVTNNPTVTTVPASPASLLAATTKAATMTLTTPPTTPGMFLIFTPGGNSATGTIVLSGNDIYGNAYATSETINVGANNNVVYSQRRYSSLASNQFTTTGLSVGATLAVTGVYAWTYTGTWDGITNLSKATATLELYDGVQGIVMPYTFLSDGTITWEKEKEILFAGKGEAQDFLIVGDPNPSGSYPSGTNPFATLSQPTTMPLPAWSSTFWIDALPGGTPFTTQDGSIIQMKIGLNTGLKAFFVGDGMQRWSDTTYGGEPHVDLEATLVYQNYKLYEQYFKPNNKFVLGVTFNGTLLGSISPTTYFENVQFTFPVRIDTLQVNRGKDPVEVSMKFFTEYAFDLGYAFRMSMTAQVPPTYTS